jgi:hypothetical protein
VAPYIFEFMAALVMLYFLSGRRHRVALRRVALSLARGLAIVLAGRVLWCDLLLVCSLCQLGSCLHESQRTATAREPPVPWPVVALPCCERIL